MSKEAYFLYTFLSQFNSSNEFLFVDWSGPYRKGFGSKFS